MATPNTSTERFGYEGVVMADPAKPWPVYNPATDRPTDIDWIEKRNTYTPTMDYRVGNAPYPSEQ